MKLLFDPVIPLLGFYPKNPKTPIQKNLCIAAQFAIAKCRKQPKCPLVDEWIKKLVHLQNEILCSRKKGVPTLPDSMDGTGEHHAK